MLDLSFLTEYMIIPVVVIALLTGYVLKHWVSDEAFENRWIPVVVTIEGAILGLLLTIFSGEPLTANAILMGVATGGVSGASSSGLQAGFSNFIHKKEV